jgi:hypothetical protein
MGKGPDYHHHIERARSEMDCAYRARDHVAAAAHMKLSALHMERARLARGSGQPDADPGRSRAGGGR